MLEQRNLFTTKHFWTVIGLFYITSCQPAIDSAIDGNLSRKDIEHLISSVIATGVAATLKLVEPNIYTPKGIIGRDKTDVVKVAVMQPAIVEIPVVPVVPIVAVQDQPANIITTVTQVVEKPAESIVNSITKDPTINTIAEIADDIINPTNLLGKSSASSSQEQNTTGLYVKANQKTWFKTKPIDSSLLSSNEKISIASGQSLSITSYEAPSQKHIKLNCNSILGILYAFAEHVSLYKDDQLISFSTDFIPTKAQLEDIYNNTLSDALYIDFKRCLQTFGINTHEDVCQFLGQVGAESAGLIYTKEIASGDDYEGREDLGNTQKGDGCKFKGSGFIQLTGRGNYTSFSKDINDPEVIKQGCYYVADNYPFTSAGWFWNKNTLSDYINKEGADIYMVTRVVNGGLNGIDDRIAYYNKAHEVLA